jgi:hypothetical protein
MKTEEERNRKICLDFLGKLTLCEPCRFFQTDASNGAAGTRNPFSKHTGCKVLHFPEQPVRSEITPAVSTTTPLVVMNPIVRRDPNAGTWIGQALKLGATSLQLS